MTTASNNVTYPDLLETNLHRGQPVDHLEPVRRNPYRAHVIFTTEPFQAQFAAMSADTDPVDRTAKVYRHWPYRSSMIAAHPVCPTLRAENCYWPWVQKLLWRT